MIKMEGLVMVIVVSLMALLGQRVGAEMHHHVVGDDRGWDPSTDIASWSSGRLFRVGDILWFSYSAVQESVVELESMNEFLSCDLTNPIKMYGQGIDKVPLDDEGIRYFASGNLESCKKGLKIHVNVVHPKDKEVEENEKHFNDVVLVAADGPTMPSSSAHLVQMSTMLWVGLLCYLGF